MMDESIYQDIYDIIANTLPDEWKKVVLYMNYSEGSYSIKYYVKNKFNQYKDCYSLEGVSKTGLIKIFIEINKIIAPERNVLSEKDKWSVMTLTIEKTGSFNVEYEYGLMESMFESEAAWERKYLL